MASQVALKRACLSSSRAQATFRVQRRMYASHEPHFHEPSGLMFGEPVSPTPLILTRKAYANLFNITLVTLLDLGA